MRKIWVVIFSLFFMANLAKAQVFTPRVSKDSLAILNARLEALKASAKVQELKIKEAEGEEEVEKLRIRLLEANAIANSSAAQQNNLAEKTRPTVVDSKTSEKAAKRAKNDAVDAQRALERFNKQIQKVEDIKTQIQGEERKLTYKKPLVIYDYK